MIAKISPNSKTGITEFYEIFIKPPNKKTSNIKREGQKFPRIRTNSLSIFQKRADYHEILIYEGMNFL